MLMDQARQSRQQPAPGQQAQSSGAATSPDWKKFTPPELVDPVERIIAAGVKVMYSPEARDQLKQAVAADMPVAQKMAQNVVGLLLTLDKQSQGGLPVAALFPAAMGLLGEAATVLQQAGQQVTQDDWNEAAMMTYVLIGKKLGGTDEQIMQGAQGAMGQGAAGVPGAAEPEDATEPNEQPEGTPTDMKEDQAEGEPPDPEEQQMRAGYQQ